MNIDLIKTFLAIVDTGGFTKASQAVHRSQSAISLQVNRLEDIMGNALFIRSGRSLSLTAEGETLIPYARRMLKLHEETMAVMTVPNVVGSVRLGIFDDYVAHFLPAILSRFAKNYPMIQVTVDCAQSSQLEPDLATGELDLAIVAGRPDESGDIIKYDPAVWVTSDNHLIHEEDPLPLAIFHTKCITRKWQCEALDSANRNYRIAYQSPSDSGIIAIVSAGLAVAVLLKSTVPDNFRILGTKENFPELPVAKIVLKHSPGAHSKAVECMAQHIREGVC